MLAEGERHASAASIANIDWQQADPATELDAGNPQELAQQYLKLRRRLADPSVLGGCCGTNHLHIVAICTCVPTAEM